MSKIIDRITNLFQPAKPLPAGLYHYQTPPQAERQYRLHLRVNEDGGGLLIINASTVLHLNRTAAEFVYHLIQETPVEEVARMIASRYRISRNDARLDFLEVKSKILTLLDTPDLDPVSFLEISREEPYSETISAPYRLDCALTYRLPDSSNPQFAPTRRVDRELTTEEWYTIIDRAWEMGIPHLIFTGGEPTLREDLIALIKKAEQNGQVTGLLSDGLKFKDDGFRKEILISGLDHLLFLLSENEEVSWQALQAILDEDLYTTVHITVTPTNTAKLGDIIARCKDLGANSISLSAVDIPDEALDGTMSQAHTLVAEADVPLKWDLPVPYSAHNPIALELKKDQGTPQGAGRAWAYVEPDGDVLPGQGINQILGNMLDDNWQMIWGQERTERED